MCPAPLCATDSITSSRPRRASVVQVDPGADAVLGVSGNGAAARGSSASLHGRRRATLRVLSRTTISTGSTTPSGRTPSWTARISDAAATRPISADGTATVVSRGLDDGRERDPVEADDPDVVRDPDAEVAQRVHQPERQLVVVADERLGQVGGDLRGEVARGAPGIDRRRRTCARARGSLELRRVAATVSARIVFEARTPLST